MRLNSGKYIARGGPTEVSRQSGVVPSNLHRFSGRRPHHLPVVHGLSFFLPSAPTPTPFALSLHLPLAMRSHCSCNFHASKATDTSAWRPFAKFDSELQQVLPKRDRAGATAAGTPRLNVSASPMKKHQTASIRGVTLICHLSILFIDFSIEFRVYLRCIYKLSLFQDITKEKILHKYKFAFILILSKDNKKFYLTNYLASNYIGSAIISD